MLCSLRAGWAHWLAGSEVTQCHGTGVEGIGLDEETVVGVDEVVGYRKVSRKVLIGQNTGEPARRPV